MLCHLHHHSPDRYAAVVWRTNLDMQWNGGETTMTSQQLPTKCAHLQHTGLWDRMTAKAVTGLTASTRPQLSCLHVHFSQTVATLCTTPQLVVLLLRGSLFLWKKAAGLCTSCGVVNSNLFLGRSRVHRTVGSTKQQGSKRYQRKIPQHVAITSWPWSLPAYHTEDGKSTKD